MIKCIYVCRRCFPFVFLMSLLPLLLACAFARAPQSAAPTPTTDMLHAASVAVQYAQTNIPYLRLEGEPTDIRGQCVQGSQSVCSVYIIGRVINTIPAGAGGSPPERTETLPLLRIQLNGTSFEIMGSTGFPAAQAPDISHLERIPYQK